MIIKSLVLKHFLRI